MKIKKENVIKAIRKWGNDPIPSNTKYYLFYADRLYPAKDIVWRAYNETSQGRGKLDESLREKLSGGRGSGGTNEILRKLGFLIVKNVWVLNPGKEKEFEREGEFEKEGEFERECLENDYVRIGWEEATGDIKDAKKEDIKYKLKIKYPDEKEVTINRWAKFLFEFANEIHGNDRENDIIFMPLKKGDKKKVAKGIITGGYEFRDGELHIHPVKWESKSSLRKDFHSGIQKRLGRPPTLAKITENCFPTEEIEEVTMPEKSHPLIEQLKQFHQIILQGPPGTGKTYEAKRVAKALTGEKNPGDRWELIQFHPSYNYEDFVRGIQISTEDGKTRYETVNRVLMQITEKASNDPENPYLLIIDEINRANVAAVLGELIYALEYRGETVRTPYEVGGNAKIALPKKLYIIGTMNTADRTIGQIDYAVRRRFAFISCQPKREILEKVSEAGSAVALFDMVAGLFKEGSEFLSSDYHTDDVAIGHSYFIAADDEILKLNIEFQVIPILEEYIKDGVLKEESKTMIQEIKKFSYGKNTNSDPESSEDSETQDLINKEIEKVRKRLVGWANDPEQINHKMLRCFLELRYNTQGKITRETFKQEYKNDKEFNESIFDMYNIERDRSNRGKVFERKGEVFEIWEPVRDDVKKFAETIGIPWED